MNENGMMDKGPLVSGKKALIVTIGGLIVFTIVMLGITLAIGKYGGKVLDKKAMEHERAIDTQIMRDKEANHQH